MKGPYHAKTFVLNTRFVAGNQSLVENLPAIRDAEARCREWLDRENRQMTLMAMYKSRHSSIYDRPYAMAACIGTRCLSHCREVLDAAKSAAEAGKYFEYTTPNQSVVRIENALYPSGFSIDGRTIMSGHTVFSPDAIGRIIGIINQSRQACDDVDLITGCVTFRLENCRCIATALLRDYNDPRFTVQIHHLLIETAIPLIMSDDNSIVLEEGYSYPESNPLTPNQQHLLYESLSAGYGCFDWSGGWNFCCEQDPDFPLDLMQYRAIAGPRVARIRRVDPNYYDLLREPGVVIMCGRIASALSGTCSHIFRGAYASLEAGPERCSKCNFTAKNGRAMTVLPTPPICRQHYPSQNVWDDKSGDRAVSRTTCTCPPGHNAA